MQDYPTNTRSKSARMTSPSKTHGHSVARIPGRTYVDHTYHDHLHDPVDLPSSISLPEVTGADCPTKHKKGPRGGVTVAFPEKLHEMLTAAVEEGFEHVVSWLPHGRSFLIHDKVTFLDEVMPRFFHQSKLTSFQRQLNLYGFVRLTAGKDRGSYYHELFLRGRPDLCQRMVRTRVKGNGMKAASSPETEPDFYAMEPCLGVNSTSLVSDDSSREEEVGGLWTIKADPIPSSFMKPVPSVSSFDPPAIVSLPSSPEQSVRPVTTELPEGWPVLSLSIPEPASVDDMNMSNIGNDDGDVDSFPKNGDEVFFEGLKFRYLDHVELDVKRDDFVYPQDTFQTAEV